jgi:hypothetical protein
VKRLRGKLLKGEKTIEGISYQPGKGWHHNGKKISVHGLDAYLVYWLWNDKQNKPLNSFSYEPNKVKPKVKEKLSKKTKRTEPDWDELEEPGPECPGSLCFECDSSSCVCDIIFCHELEEPEEQDDIDQETKDHD